MTKYAQVLRRSLRSTVLAFVGLAVAAAVAAAPRKVAVISLIGDKLEVVYPQMPTGSRLNQNVRHEIDDRKGEFDRFTLAASAQAIAEVDPAIGTVLISLGPSSLHDRPEKLFEGKQAVLPGKVVDELERVQAQYLLLITKQRGDARLGFVNERTGVGSVRGLGFYLDEDTRVQMVDSDAQGDGLIAPFAYFRLSLVDVQSGELVREERVMLMDVLAVAARPGVAEPWNVLDAKEKVAYIERLIRKGLKEKVRPLLEGL
jgi:hypothetical protein